MNKIEFIRYGSITKRFKAFPDFCKLEHGWDCSSFNMKCMFNLTVYRYSIFVGSTVVNPLGLFMGFLWI